MHKWVLKEINSSLYLMLPKKYLTKKNISPLSVEAFTQDTSLTPIEWQLGLKVNHLQTVDITAVQPLLRTEENEGLVLLADYFIPVEKPFATLETIFVTQKDYPHRASAPATTIMINGHGELDQSICSLSIDQFKQFLLFLEKIKTKLLIYLSCYSTGTNADLLYKDAMSGIDRTYDFPIVSLAITDAMSLAHDLKITWEDTTPSLENRSG